jgi:predicted DNA-binding protein (MmcQ/YjbR family)
MNYDALNTFCARLPATTHVVQWGGSDVYKVGGKVFALINISVEAHVTVSFKVTHLGYEILRDHPACRPAPYLASRGMSWIQYYQDGLDEADLKHYIDASYRMIAQALPKKTQKALGLVSL